MNARHSGWCNGCGKVIVRGQEIKRARKDGTYRHAGCVGPMGCVPYRDNSVKVSYDESIMTNRG